MSFFFDLLVQQEEDKREDIKAYLEALDEEVREKLPMEPNETIRASSIWDFCPRREAIRCERKLTIREEISGRLARIFRFGRVFEQDLRDKIFGDRGLLLGLWTCVACQKDSGIDLSGALYRLKPEDPCTCGARAWAYREVFKQDEATGVGGHTDGFIRWKDQYAILEVKTANEWSFKSIVKKNRPMEAHIAQTQVYMHLHGYKKALVWYYNKNTSEQATFWVDYDRGYVNLMLEKAQAFRNYTKTGQIPERICIDKKCPRAKDCALRTVCFEEFPP